jgi:transposase
MTATAMRAWLRRQRPWLVVEPPTAYAPELNPVETLWSNLKGVELGRLTAAALQEVTAVAERCVQRIRRTPYLAYSFPRPCGLSRW